MRALKFVVRHPTGQTEEFTVDAERVLIGSGAHCEIRLPIDQAAMEHVLVTMGPSTALAEARAFEPPPTVNGSPFTQTQLLPNSVLGIGHVQILVTVVEVMGQGVTSHKKQEKTSVMTYVLAAIAVPASLYIIFTADDGAQSTAAPAEIPELWDAPLTACPQQSSEQAIAIAHDKLALAEARRERRPFHPKDGVAAVPLFETASVCFKAAGNAAAATDSAQAAATLREQVAEDYRVHRVRLEHAVSIGDWRTAQTETRMLLAFTDGKQGPYVTWLSNLDRRLHLKYGGKGRR